MTWGKFLYNVQKMADRLLIWTGVDSWRAEACEVDFEDDGIRARGVQLGAEPLPYRLSYRLDATGRGFVTRSLRLEAAGEGWERRMRLERNDSGAWSVDADGHGEADLPAPGGDPDAFAEALDCDLAFSPLTNTMPVLREGLLGGGEPRDFVMAWVSVPDLSVHRSEQRYEPLGATTVRYVGRHRNFTADLELDSEGFVVRYPELAERVHP
jgi:uncharacterized protein